MLLKKISGWKPTFYTVGAGAGAGACLKKNNPEPVTNGPALQNCCYIKSSYVLENFPYLTRVLIVPIHVFHLIKVNIWAEILKIIFVFRKGAYIADLGAMVVTGWITK